MFIVFICYGVMSSVTYLLYVKDKQAAISKHSRVSEKTLLIAGLLGGWPGGLLAQKQLRHKTAKPKFLFVFWMTAMANTATLIGFCWLNY